MSARYPSLSASVRAPLRAGLACLGLWAAAAVVLAGTVSAQAAYQPEFDVDVAAGPGNTPDETVRLDVYTAVPFSNLRFLSRASGFEASYAVTVDVYHVDERGRQQGLAVSRTYDRDVMSSTYDGTLEASQVDRAVQSIGLAPGRYSVQVAVEDGASGRTFVREVAHTVRPMDGGEAGVAMSDLLLLNRYDGTTGRIEPNVGAALSTDQGDVTVYYEVSAQAPTALRVTYVVTEQSRVRERPSFGALLGLAPSQQADLGTPVAKTEPLEVPAGRTQAAFRVETSGLKVGDYVLTVRLETPDGAAVAEADKPFAVRWMGLDQQIANLEEAVSQLRYVAKDRDIRAIRNATSEEERLRLFQDFWSHRDPTPGTDRNERMEEYYYRVAYANERYGRLRDSGWNTDRGEVFIRFGEPDLVEEHPFNFGSEPYQIWLYYRTGRRFIFVDKTGVGDFELLVPIWDERTRM